MSSSLKVACVYEFIAMLAICTVSGLYYTSDNFSTKVMFKFGLYNCRDAAFVFAGLIGALTFVGYKISGAQFSPAITIPLMLTGKENFRRGGAILLAQIVAAAVAGFIVFEINPQDNYMRNYPGSRSDNDFFDIYPIAQPNTNFDYDMPAPPFGLPTSDINWSCIISELICSLLLFFGYFCATNLKKLSSLGVAATMALTNFVVVAHSSFFSGGSVNPFRVFGMTYLYREFSLRYGNGRGYWILLAIPIPATIIASILYSLMFKMENPFSGFSFNGQNGQRPQQEPVSDYPADYPTAPSPGPQVPFSPESQPRQADSYNTQALQSPLLYKEQAGYPPVQPTDPVNQ